MIILIGAEKGGTGKTTLATNLAAQRARAGRDVLLVDAGGRDSVELRVGLVAAQKAYIPVQPSQFDIWSLDHMDELVAAAQGFNSGLRAFVLLARASPHPLVSEVAEARAFLSDYPHLSAARTVIYDRIAYWRSGREGRAVSELSPSDGKAVAELASLYKEVFDEP